MRLVGYHVELAVEGLQEPHDDARRENDRERPLEEILGLIPGEHDRRLRTRQAVIRQLHDERHRLAAEGRPFEYQRHDRRHDHAQHIQRDHGQDAPPREERGGEQTVNRELG